MFYTKYRPRSFDELCGLDNVVGTLKSQLEKGKTGHAYFFHGPRGTGKTTAARILAASLGAKQLDLIEIDAASHRGIDDIRDLRQKISLAPSQSPCKVYIIDEAHMLTKEAFNALLKTLEEPPAHAILILCTTEPHKVPATIRSRCQSFAFKRAKTADIIKKLQHIAQKEGAEVSPDDLELIAKNAEGGFRDAENLLEQVIVGGIGAREVLGLGGGESAADFTDLILGGRINDALVFINRKFSEGVDLANYTQILLEYLRGLLLIRAGVGDELVEAPEENYKRQKDQSSKVSTQLLRLMIEEFSESLKNQADAVIPTLPLEMAVVKVISENSERLPAGQAGQKVGKSESQNIRNSDESGPPDRPGRSGSSGPSKFSFPDIVSKWDSLLKIIKPYNHSLEALLRSTRPQKIDEEGRLVLEVFYPFHKERLEEARNRSLLEKVLAEVLAAPLRVRCVLGNKQEEETGKTVKAVGKKMAEVEDEALEAFNGEL